MSNRRSLPKSLRFDVLERDGFTCQYCGARAPDVALHVDHIHPVVLGGGNDVANLITSCEDCNIGKGAEPLCEDLDIQLAQVQAIMRRKMRRPDLQCLDNLREWVEDGGLPAPVLLRMASRARDNTDFGHALLTWQAARVV